jgi:hypothetical protein
MFWTKLGTSTGIAESGTVEEIDRFVESDKPAMLYLSNRPIPPSSIDTSQLTKLRDFKEATYKSALVGSFNRVDEITKVDSSRFHESDSTAESRLIFSQSP